MGYTHVMQLTAEELSAARQQIQILEKLTRFTCILFNKKADEIRCHYLRDQEATKFQAPLIYVAYMDYSIPIKHISYFLRLPISTVYMKFNKIRLLIAEKKPRRLVAAKQLETIQRLRLAMRQPDTIYLPFTPHLSYAEKARRSYEADGAYNTARYKTQNGYIDCNGQIILRPPG